MRSFLICLIITSLLGCSKDKSVFPEKLTLTDVGINSAVVNVDLSRALEPDILEMGLCWSKSPMPTRSRDQVMFIKNNGQNLIKDSIAGLNYNTYYHVRAFLKTNYGLKYSNEITLKTLTSPFKIGQVIGNGFVFHIDSSGMHGLIASRSIGHAYWTAWWDGFKYKYIGTSSKFGTGQENTKKIIAAGLTAPNTAAIFCENFTQDGYDDWFLPSYEELTALKNIIGSSIHISQYYPGDIYWSSSEVSANMASQVWFSAINAMADFFYDNKDSDHGIIPVRKF